MPHVRPGEADGPALRLKGQRRYVQLVENHREGRHTRQPVLATLGCVDQVTTNGQVGVLLRSLGRFAGQVRLIEGQRGREFLQVVVVKLLIWTFSQGRQPVPDPF